MLAKLLLKVFLFLSFVFDPVNHHSNNYIDSSPLSRRFSRCLLALFPLITDGFRCLLFIHSRRFVLSAARYSFRCFVRAPHDCPIAIFVFRAFVLAVVDYSIFLCSCLRARSISSSSLYSTIRFFFDFFAYSISNWSFAAFLLCFVGLLGPGVLASIPFSIRFSSAADLNDTPLRLINDPFFICTVCFVNFSIFNGKRLYLLRSFGSVFPVFWNTVVVLVL